MTPPPDAPSRDDELPPLAEFVHRLVMNETRPVVNGMRYALGQDLAPAEPTPKDLVWSQGKVELFRFRSGQIQYGPPIVLMLGLASRSSLFDLYPGGSMAASLVDAGFDVFMISWGAAGPAEAENPLEIYTQRFLPRILRAVTRVSGAEGVTLLGYCMGGNFALMALASQPDLPVTNLVTVATPVDWDHMPKHLDPLRKKGFKVADHVDETGCIPADSVVRFNQIRRPTADVVQLGNLAENLDNVGYLAVHQAISRWGQDQIPFPRKAAQQLIDHWMHENAFASARLRVDGHPVDLQRITCPALLVSATRDEIVPAEAANPGIDVIGSSDKLLIELDAGHVGLTFGRSAKKLLHPRLIEWLRVHATPVTGAGETTALGIKAADSGRPAKTAQPKPRGAATKRRPTSPAGRKS